MNRRSFLKSILSAAVLAQADISTILDSIILDTEHLSDGEFVTYIKFQMNMWVSHPGSCALISDIGEK